MVAVETTLILIILNAKKKGGDGELADSIAGSVTAGVLAELRAQQLENTAAAREQRQELLSIISESNTQTARLIQSSSETMSGTLLRFGQDQQKSLFDMQTATQKNMTDMHASMQKSLSDMQSAIRDKVDERLDAIQKSNEQKIDEMRRTVDEKLETTLNARLKNSFEIVNQQLQSVNTRLGEMLSVADSVSNLNKALSGSKTRGILGELQLSQIIEDMLPSQLYEREAQMREGSRDRVEYAIKMPGQDDDGFVYLPIDSKFPLDNYYRLVEDYEKGDAAAVEEHRKALLMQIKESAKSVKEKYINPPFTTTFAVIFLPTEGLYAEAVRDAAFFEELRKFGVMLAGPTTLSALLSSLLVGFKTLQIQKGAVEIQRTLEKTKKEFGNFGSVLGKAQDRIRQTGEEIDKLVGTRTRMINLALKNVQTYSIEGSEEIFSEIENQEVEENEDSTSIDND